VTLVLAAIAVVGVGALRVSELASGAIIERRGMDAGQALAASVQQLQSVDSDARVSGVKGLAGVLFAVGSASELSRVRADAMVALRRALADGDQQVKLQAASALGISGSFAREAKAELLAVLSDKKQNPDIRVTAARALLTITDDSPAAVLRVLSDMLSDPLPTGNRRVIVTAMRCAGKPGTEAALEVMNAMLRSPNELLQFDVLECVPALEQDASRLVAAIEPLFKSANAELRYFAAMAAAQGVADDQPAYSAAIKVLAEAACDASLGLGLREKAIGELMTRSPKQLVDCGLALARQLDAAEYDSRFAAATLLHQIEPEFLVRPNVAAGAR
jgi:hypothetical protein